MKDLQSLYPTPKNPNIKSSQDIKNDLLKTRRRNINRLPVIVSMYLTLLFVTFLVGHYLGLYILANNVISGVFMAVLIGLVLFFLALKVFSFLSNQFYYLVNISAKRFIALYMIFIAPECVVYSIFASNFTIWHSVMAVLCHAVVVYLLTSFLIRLEIKYEKSL